MDGLVEGRCQSPGVHCRKEPKQPKAEHLHGCYTQAWKIWHMNYDIYFREPGEPVLISALGNIRQITFKGSEMFL